MLRVLGGGVRGVGLFVCWQAGFKRASVDVEESPTFVRVIASHNRG